MQFVYAGELVVIRKVNELHSRDWGLVSYLVKESAEVETCYNMFQRFREMIGIRMVVI